MKTNTDGASLWKAGWGVLYRDHLCVVQARDGFKGGKSHWKVKESPIGRHNLSVGTERRENGRTSPFC
nr:hypothetical protein [Tanacetum cinerariifolium]